MKLKFVTNTLLISASALSLFACGNDEETEPEDDSIEHTIEAPISEEMEEDEQTGEESERTEDNTGEQSSLSELVNMSDEERLAHHLLLGQNPCSLPH